MEVIIFKKNEIKSDLFENQVLWKEIIFKDISELKEVKNVLNNKNNELLTIEECANINLLDILDIYENIHNFFYLDIL